ncbi:uncharacterized protein PG998_014022 [Apiospora kogelbergensis]|uniref:uncharacterized protein n=1 Tax=Apiospora kogelbergensis TaxID=1337665 RepID=UPI003131A2F6
MGVKVYYLAPTRHMPPDGPIALGSIITDPRRPEIAINSSTPAIQELKVHETVELNQSRTLEDNATAQPSVWAKFLGGVVPGLGVDAEAGIRAASGNRSSYAFEKIVTREIFPDLETVRSLFSGDACVQQSIKDRRWQLSVFLITGVQVAYGAEVLLTRARERGVYLQTGVDLTAVTGGIAPVSVGGGLDASKAHSQSLSTNYQTPFVFAYRLRQILYRRKKVQEQRDHIKGDLLGVYDGKENMRLSSDEGGEVYEVQFAGLDKEDVDLPEIFNLNTEDMASPEGEYHRIAFPQPEDADSDDN